MRWALAVACLGACSGTRGPSVEDARAVAAGSGSAAAIVAPASPGGKGDAQIRVEWKAPPAAVVASPGRDACGMARAAAVAPTSTWGIPDVAVWVDVAPVTLAPAPPVRVTIGPCGAVPRVQVARPGATLVVASATEGPIAATVQHYRAPGDGSAASATPLLLPAIGHAVALDLAAPAVAAIGDAWVIAVPTAGGVTDAQGQVVLRDLPAGAHALTAWLPARGGAAARVVHGAVDVLPGGLAEVTIDLLLVGAP